MKPATPIFRIFDESKAREFYLDYLGFAVEFEHRFADDMPLYLGLRLGDCKLHLSEHHGDCTPGGAIRIEVENIQELLAELQGKGYRSLNPGIQKQPWGSLEMDLLDPFGNRLTMFETIDEER